MILLRRALRQLRELFRLGVVCRGLRQLSCIDIDLVCGNHDCGNLGIRRRPLGPSHRGSQGQNSHRQSYFHEASNERRIPGPVPDSFCSSHWMSRLRAAFLTFSGRMLVTMGPAPDSQTVGYAADRV
jgi:hypothetical protein